MATTIFVLLLLGVSGVSSLCTSSELQSLLSCLQPYNAQFIAALTGDSCDRDQITDQICTSFAAIVTCTNGKDVSDTTCRPDAIGQMNAELVVPCKIEDFQAVCTNAPAINTGSGVGAVRAGWTTAVVVAVVLATLNLFR